MLCINQLPKMSLVNGNILKRNNYNSRYIFYFVILTHIYIYTHVWVSVCVEGGRRLEVRGNKVRQVKNKILLNFDYFVVVVFQRQLIALWKGIYYKKQHNIKKYIRINTCYISCTIISFWNSAVLLTGDDSLSPSLRQWIHHYACTVVLVTLC